MKNCNLVSVIMPVFNASETIKSSINSVLSQNYSNWELLVIDDGSIDDSIEIIKAFERIDFRIKLLKNRYFKGAAGARQTGLDYSSGKFVAFLDSDDEWGYNKLNIFITFMIKNKYDFCYGGYDVFSNANPLLYTYHPPLKIVYSELLKYCPIGCLTVVIRKDFIGNVTFKDIHEEDYMFWLDLLKDGGAAYCAPGSLSRYRVGNSSLSSNKIVEIKKQYGVLHAQGVNILSSLFYIAFYIYKGISKSLRPFLKSAK